MKMGILTFHSGNNYGATLQAYALKTVLETKGQDVSVIDFRKEKRYSSSKVKNFFSPARLARRIYTVPYINSIKQKNAAFEKFLRDYVLDSDSSVVTEDNIENEAKKYSALIFGSDQIWNMDERIYDRSKVFFGDFKFNGVKYAYSASFGDSIELAEENKDYILKQLADFKKISVREMSGNDFLQNYGIDSVHTVDPTMLLPRSEWEKIVDKEPAIKGKYVLYYSVNCRKYSWNVAKRIGKELGLPVINLIEHPKIFGSGFENHYSYGPLGFLNILKNAECVVTNSFHGVIFSLIFNVPFLPVFSENNGKIELEERKYSILKTVGLEQLITTESSMYNADQFNSIKWSEVNENIRKEKDKSLAYIDTIIESIEK